MRVALFSAALFLLSLPAMATEATAPLIIKVENVRALALKADEGRPTAIFFDLHNEDKNPARLTQVSAPDVCGRAELHTHSEENGVMAMRKADRFDIPAGETFALKPMGPHVMCFDLKKDLNEGDAFNVILGFGPSDATVRASGTVQTMKQIMDTSPAATPVHSGH